MTRKKKYRTDWVPAYVEAVEQAIRDNVAQNGCFPEQEEGKELIGSSHAYFLSKALTDLSAKLAVELEQAGDINITHTLMLALICHAWSSFIIKAKAKSAYRYGDASCKHMNYLVKKFIPRMLNKVHKAALKYGDSYNV